MARSSYSIFTAVGMAIMLSVSVVMAVGGVASFLYAEQVLSSRLQRQTEASVAAVARSVAPYLQAYAVSDYLSLVAHEMDQPDLRAIVVRDFQMAELTGRREFVVGKLRGDDGALIDYDHDNPGHRTLATACFQARTAPILTDIRQTIGAVAVCASDQSVQIELRRTIKNSGINLALLSVVLIGVLFLIIYRVVILPVSSIAKAVSERDARGIPRSPAAVTGPREIAALADGINRMIVMVQTSIDGIELQRTALEDQKVALSAAEQALREIIWGTHAGTWEWNVETGDLNINEFWAELVGRTLADLEPVSIETWRNLVHPDDLAHADAQLQRCFSREHEFYECEIRMRHRNGDWVWVLTRGKVVEWGVDGHPMRMSGIHFDITERKSAQAQQERINYDLMRSNEDLEQFSYAISHDLQAPLRNIASFLQLLERRCGDELSSDAKEYIAFAVNGAKRMSEMIHSVLEYSRVRSQGAPFEPVDLGLVLQSALQDLASTLADKHAVISIGSLPRVLGDPSQLERVFQNLIENALKYQRTGVVPEVTIAAVRTDDGWEVSVQDNGIGIPPDQIGQLLKVFKRLHTYEEYQGHGVGLAVCKRIVMRHGGRIWLESAGADRGCRAVFTLQARLDVPYTACTPAEPMSVSG